MLALVLDEIYTIRGRLLAKDCTRMNKLIETYLANKNARNAAALTEVAHSAPIGQPWS